VSSNISFFESVPYYTIIHSNNDICGHFPTIVILPSSQSMTLLKLRMLLQHLSRNIIVVHNLLKFQYKIRLRWIKIWWSPCLILPQHDLQYWIQFSLKMIGLLLFEKVHVTCNLFPHYTNLSYHQLSNIHYTCLFSLSSIPILKSQGKVLSHPEW